MNIEPTETHCWRRLRADREGSFGPAPNMNHATIMAAGRCKVSIDLQRRAWYGYYELMYLLPRDTENTESPSRRNISSATCMRVLGAPADEYAEGPRKERRSKIAAFL